MRSAILIGTLVLVGCGPTLRPLHVYDDAMSRDDPRLAERLAPGRDLLVGPTCAVQSGASFVEATEAAPAPFDPSGEGMRVWRIEETAAVLDGERGGIGLHIVSDEGRDRHVVMAATDVGCLRVAPPAARAILKRVGDEVTFGATAATCRAVVARGASARAFFTEAAPGSTPSARVVGIAPIEAPPGQAAPLFVRLDNGVDVRLDTFSGCLVAPEERDGAATATALLRTDLGRCATSTEAEGEHVGCSTSVGVWSGIHDETEVSLTLQRRTLGTFHFLGDRLVAPERWARATMAFAVGQADTPAASAVQTQLARALPQAARAIDGLRIVALEDDAAYELRVDVGRATIGPPRRGVVKESSRYQDGFEEVPNPELPALRDEVDAAEGRLDAAIRQFESDVEDARRERAAREAVLQACRRAAAEGDKQTKAIVGAGCDIGEIASQGVGRVSNDGKRQAEADLQSARSRLDDAPRTVKEPIYKSWPYDKITYARDASAEVVIKLRRKGRGSEEDIRVPVHVGWSDHEVTADPAHEVPGHSVDRRFLDGDEALSAQLGREASRLVAERVAALVRSASLAELQRAYVESGGTSQAGYEPVDAVAFDVAKARPLVPGQRGAVSAAGSVDVPLRVPTSRGRCSIVAVVADDVSGVVGITSRRGEIADQRGLHMAAIEVCGGEAPDPLPVTLRAQGSPARWTIYTLDAAPAPKP